MGQDPLNGCPADVPRRPLYDPVRHGPTPRVALERPTLEEAPRHASGCSEGGPRSGRPVSGRRTEGTADECHCDVGQHDPSDATMRYRPTGEG